MLRALNEAALLATIWNLRRATIIHGDIFVSNAYIIDERAQGQCVHKMKINEKWRWRPATGDRRHLVDGTFVEPLNQASKVRQ